MSLYAGRFFEILNYFYGSAREYHCEVKPDAINRYRPHGVKAVFRVRVIVYTPLYLSGCILFSFSRKM
jgi:hypothetical protein